MPTRAGARSCCRAPRRSTRPRGVQWLAALLPAVAGGGHRLVRALAAVPALRAAVAGDDDLHRARRPACTGADRGAATRPRYRAAAAPRPRCAVGPVLRRRGRRTPRRAPDAAAVAALRRAARAAGCGNAAAATPTCSQLRLGTAELPSTLHGARRHRRRDRPGTCATSVPRGVDLRAARSAWPGRRRRRRHRLAGWSASSRRCTPRRRRARAAARPGAEATVAVGPLVAAPARSRRHRRRRRARRCCSALDADVDRRRTPAARCARAPGRGRCSSSTARSSCRRRRPGRAPRRRHGVGLTRGLRRRRRGGAADVVRHRASRVRGATGTRGHGPLRTTSATAHDAVTCVDQVDAQWADARARELAPLVDAGAARAAGRAATVPAARRARRRRPDADARRCDALGRRRAGGCAAPCSARRRRPADGRSGRRRPARAGRGHDRRRASPNCCRRWSPGSPPTTRRSEVNFLLIDYKGGAAFADCARLPHTAGLVTDLDPYLTARALRSLDSELRRRERLFAAAGAADLAALPAARPPQPLPRLVIVVDEFATLADELPDFVRGLVGVAQRGRSLGVHLVLATQRPGRRRCRRRSGPTPPAHRAAGHRRRRVERRHRRAGRRRHRPQTARPRPSCAPGEQLGCSRPRTRAGGRTTPATSVAVEVLGRVAPPCAAPTGRRGHGESRALVDAVAARPRASSVRRRRSPWLPPLPDRCPSRLGDRTAADDRPSRRRASSICPTSSGSTDAGPRPRAGPSVLLAGGAAVRPHHCARGARARGRGTVLDRDELHLHVVDAAGALAQRSRRCRTAPPSLGPDDLAPAPTLLRRLAEAGRRATHSRGRPSSAPAARSTAGTQLRRVVDDADAARLRRRARRPAALGPAAGLRVAVTGDRSASTPAVRRRLRRRASCCAWPTAATTRWPASRPRDVPRTCRPAAACAPATAPCCRSPTPARRPGSPPPDGAAASVAGAGARHRGAAVRAPTPIRIRAAAAHRRARRARSRVAATGARSCWASAATRRAVVTSTRSPAPAGCSSPGRRARGAAPCCGSLLARRRAPASPAVVARRDALAAAPQRPAASASSVIDPADARRPAAVPARLPAAGRRQRARSSTPPPASALTGWLRAGTAPLAVVVAGRADDLATSYRGVAAEVRRSRCGMLLRPGPVDGELLGVAAAPAAQQRTARPRRASVGEPALGRACSRRRAGPAAGGAAVTVELPGGAGVSPCAGSGDRSAARTSP